MGDLRRIVAAMVVVALAAGGLSAQITPKGDPVKWSQPVDLEQGYDIGSYWRLGDPAPTTVVADDWRCLDGRPVTDVHWWGSYLTGDTVGLSGFEISIHADVPADALHPSHPGDLLYFTILNRQQFQEQFYFADGETVFQYNADLPVPFPQQQGQIYWLDIIGLVDNSTTWGWHTAVRPGPENGLDAAVMLFDYSPVVGTPSYTQWGALYDFCHVQMAFELTTIPEPGTFALAGTAALMGLGVLRRRRMR